MAKFQTHDEYIDAAPEQFHDMLRDVRSTLRAALPDAEELIMYDMPGFGFGKMIIVGYAAFSKQCGIYVDNQAIEACAAEIADAGLKATKTGVTFSLKKPIPDALVAKLALSSRAELGV